MGPNGVGYSGEDRVAGNGDDALGLAGQRVGNNGEHSRQATPERPNRVARKQRVDLHLGKNLCYAKVLIFKIKELLMVGRGAELKYE